MRWRRRLAELRGHLMCHLAGTLPERPRFRNPYYSTDRPWLPSAGMLAPVIRLARGEARSGGGGRLLAALQLLGQLVGAAWPRAADQAGMSEGRAVRYYSRTVAHVRGGYYRPMNRAQAGACCEPRDILRAGDDGRTAAVEKISQR